jgi:hypothetical protein
MRSAWIIVVALGGGCKDDAAALAAGGQGARDVLIAAWKREGLEVAGMSPKEVSFGKDCQGGTVKGIDILICTYPTPAEAKAAEEAGLALVGAATGLSEAKGAVLIVAADRNKADPNGRTLNLLTKLAPK